MKLNELRKPMVIGSVSEARIEEVNERKDLTKNLIVAVVNSDSDKGTDLRNKILEELKGLDCTVEELNRLHKENNKEIYNITSQITCIPQTMKNYILTLNNGGTSYLNTKTIKTIFCLYNIDKLEDLVGVDAEFKLAIENGNIYYNIVLFNEEEQKAKTNRRILKR